MESAVFKVDVRAGTVRIKNALFLGSTYAVTIEGYDYEETPPTITLSDHKGNPLAVSEVDEQDGHIISLDTQELLDYFKKGCMKGCIKAANVHCTINTTDATLASSTMPVFWSQYYTAPSGTLTKIDVKGPKGDPGDPGPKGDKGDDGTVITARGFFHFTVDEDSHLWVHASREQDLYEMGPDGQPDTTKPLFILGDGTGGTEAYHLYYVVYDPGDGQTSRKIDLGYVKGQDGEAFVPDIDSVPTANSSNLVESGGVAQAIADAGSTQTAALNGAVATINTALTAKADLENGKVPVSQLPSFVSDIKEYPTAADFPEDGEAGKIYVAKDTNLTYRWSGTGYVEISQSLALGETASTAYAGDKGKANADAITAIKDGASIDSFGDVENALGGKADKVSGATEGHFAALDANGNLTDGGKTATDFATAAQGAKADSAYQKPSGGIPSSDMAETVQTSLGRADTALQSAPVSSVNAKTGAVVLDAHDVGALSQAEAVAGYTDWTVTPSPGYTLVSGPTWNAMTSRWIVVLRDTQGVESATSIAAPQDATELTDPDFTASRTRLRPTAAQEAAWDARAQAASLAAPFSVSSTYAVGDYCTKDGGLYKCTTAVATAGAWNAANWTAVAVTDEMGGGGIAGVKLNGTTVTPDAQGAVNLDVVPWANAGRSAVTIGTRTGTIGAASLSVGKSCKASGDNSVATGNETEATSMYSHAEGGFTKATAWNSHAEGVRTTASGNPSHAEGENTTASGTRSHAEGYYATASGQTSHAEGAYTYATSSTGPSHAEGVETTAAGANSHADGYRAVTAASGNGATATTPHDRAFAWQGDNSGSYYHSHGAGTFNINPAGGAAGFYIGESTFPQAVAAAAPVTSVAGKTGVVTLDADDMTVMPSGRTVQAQFDRDSEKMDAFRRYSLDDPESPRTPDPVSGNVDLDDLAINIVSLAAQYNSVTLFVPYASEFEHFTRRARDFIVVISSASASTGNVSVSFAGEVTEILTPDGTIPDIPLGGTTYLYFTEVAPGSFMLRGEQLAVAAATIVVPDEGEGEPE